MLLVTKVLIVPIVIREGKDMVVAVEVEKAVEKVFLEVAVEKVMGGNMVEVEAMAKKVVKENHLIILLTYVHVIFVIRQVIFRIIVRTLNYLQKCLQKQKIETPRVTYRKEEK
jgi:predicted RND superfamily exporter protein